MSVAIQYISGGLWIAQVENLATEVAADLTITHKKPSRLLDAWGLMVGAGDSSDTVTIKKNSTAVSDAVDCSAKADKATFLFGTLDDAQMDFEDGDTTVVDLADDALVRITMLFAERDAAL